MLQRIGMAELATAEQKGGNKEEFSLEEMMEAGLHFGHKTSKTHPKMKPYIGGARNSIHIFNLEKTREKLEEVLEVVSNLVALGKVILLVGTKVQVKNQVRELGQATGLPFVTERWIGGLLTNFETIQKRMQHLKDLEAKQASEDFKKYTKWEQHEMEEERKKLERKFGGVKNLERLPDALFIFDLDANKLAMNEARHKGISILAIVDTNGDPTKVDYMIPANDDAASSIRYIVEKVKNAIQDAQKKNPGEKAN